jgi:hypothetical protein
MECVMPARPLDVTGEKFNQLTAVKRVDSGSGHGTIWLWKCECGTEKEIPLSDVKRGTTKSCGCGRARDLTNKRYGRLTAVQRSENNAQGVCWLFRCDCGQEKSLLAESVTRGLTKSCGCLKKEALKKPRANTNIASQRFGRLVAIQRVDASKWLFKCDCGSDYTGCKSSVVKGDVVSCGCKRKEAITGIRRDYTGMRFGALTALKPVRNKKGYWAWLFQCDCGKQKSCYAQNVTRGLTASCGCMKRHGLDSIGAYLGNYFKNPERQCELYIYELKHYPGQLKVGIDSTGLRGKDAQYGKQLASFPLTRLEAWVIEQAVLDATRHWYNPPAELVQTKWGGYRELRCVGRDAMIETVCNFVAGAKVKPLDIFILENVKLRKQERQKIKNRLDTGGLPPSPVLTSPIQPK